MSAPAGGPDGRRGSGGGRGVRLALVMMAVILAFAALASWAAGRG
ncbi:hypothetical protein [Kineococcus terrestris]